MEKFWQKFSKVTIAMCLIMSLCISFIGGHRTHADSGYDTSYDSGSYSSSSDWDSSSSSDWSSSSSNYSYHSSGGGSGDGSAFAGVVIWIIIIIIIIIISSKRKNIEQTLPKLQSNAEAIRKNKEVLTGFDENQFLQAGYNIYLDVQNAWMNFELDKVHNKITDELFNQYEAQLSSMEIKGEQNVMNGFVLRDNAIRNCVVENDNLEVTTRYIVEFYDYIINKESGEVLRGTKSRKVRLTYDITFIMKANGEKITHCPNCGAPVEVNASGVCPYCSSKIVGENTEWVMSKKISISQNIV